MKKSAQMMNVYLEAGEKKVFACVVDWPGWSRAGRDEVSALQALFDTAPRYAAVLRAADVPFASPASLTSFHVIERLQGNTTTDFGAPDVVPACDAQPLTAKDLPRLQALLKAYWQAFDEAVRRAEGKSLQAGPRGGGRDLARIVDHVIQGEVSYLGRLAWKMKSLAGADPIAKRDAERQAVLDALESAMKNGLPAAGPRGGKIWPARYFVRRSGWHVLDHVWEIEDRLSN